MHKWASRCVQGRGIIVVRPKDLEQIRGNTQKFIAYVGNMMSRISSSSAAASGSTSSAGAANANIGGQLNNGAGDLSGQVQQLPQQQQLQQQANGGQLTGSSVASGAAVTASFDPTSFNPPPRLRPEDLRPPPQKRARNTSVGSSPANAGSPSDARTPRTPANVGSPLVIESPAGMTTTRMEDPDRPRPPNQRKRKSSGSQLEGVPEEQLLPTASSASAFGLGSFQAQQGSAAGGGSSLGLQVGGGGGDRANELARAPDDPLAFLEAQWSKLQSIDSTPAALGPAQADLGLGGMQLGSPAPDPRSVFVSTSSFYNSSNGGGVAPAVLKAEPPPPAAEEAFDISWFISDECYDDAAVANSADEPAAPSGTSNGGGNNTGSGASTGGAKGGSDGRAIEAQTPDLLHSTGVEESPASTREALSPSTVGSAAGQRGAFQQQQQTPSSLSRLSIPQSGSTSSAAKTPVVPLETPVDQLFDMGPDSYFNELGTFDSEGLGESWII